MAVKANKEKALAALLDARTFSEAATAAGLSRRTLFNYLHADGDFASAYREQLELRRIEAAEQAAADMADAIRAVMDLMNDPMQPGAVRLKAAQTLIERAERGFEVESGVAYRAVETHRSAFDFDDDVWAEFLKNSQINPQIFDA